jgi:2-keto-4-pentenoate hydratase
MRKPTMLDETKTKRASDLLWNAWRDRAVVDSLPDDCRPASRAGGYAVQRHIELRSNTALYGWKIAATSVAGQKHIGVTGPLTGRLLRERVADAGATLSLSGNRMAVAEAEFAFRMGRDLSPRAARYSLAEVMAAIGSLHPSIEVPDSRYADFVTAGEAQLIADNACAHEFVEGPVAPDTWRDMDLAAHTVHATVDGSARRYERSGSGAAVLGDPRDALVWLVNELSSLGIALRAGQMVTTGACIAPLEVVPGDHVRADFGVLGAVDVRFAD